MFSPYYRKARRSGEANPENHCAINIALYGAKRRWAMTEHGLRFLKRDETSLTINRSAMWWDGDKLRITVNERCSPLPYPLRGEIILTPKSSFGEPVVLSENGNHLWQPVYPEARVEVNFDKPAVAWSGTAYHDSNWGDEPLEHAFRNWTWLRAKTKTGTHVIYDAELRNGSHTAFGRHFSQGDNTESPLPPIHNLPKAFWRMNRPIRSEGIPKLVSTFEDSPFYTRNHVELILDNQLCEAVHESLSLDRYIHPITQMMLPYKMPRRT